MSQPPEQFDLDLPDGLSRVLRGAYGHSVEISPAIDRAILGAARGRFDRRRRIKLLARWGAAVSSAAAAILLIVWVASHRGFTSPDQLATRPPAAQNIKGDIDASGQLDIVDALTLARRLRAGEATSAAWDVNADAKVDQHDVDALAAAAVNLKKQGLANRRLPSINELGLDRLPDVGPIDRDIALLQVNPEDRQ